MGWDSMLRPGTQLLAFSLAKFVPRRQANQKVLTTVSPLKTESEGLIRRFDKPTGLPPGSSVWRLLTRSGGLAPPGRRSGIAPHPLLLGGTPPGSQLN